MCQHFVIPWISVLSKYLPTLSSSELTNEMLGILQGCASSLVFQFTERSGNLVGLVASGTQSLQSDSSSFGGVIASLLSGEDDVSELVKANAKTVIAASTPIAGSKYGLFELTASIRACL